MPSPASPSITTTGMPRACDGGERFAQQPAAADEHGGIERRGGERRLRCPAAPGRAAAGARRRAARRRRRARPSSGSSPDRGTPRRGALRTPRRRCPSVRGAATRRAGSGPGVAERRRGVQHALRGWHPRPGVLPLKTTDAVDGETPASRATSEMVALRVLMTRSMLPRVRESTRRPNRFDESRIDSRKLCRHGTRPHPLAAGALAHRRLRDLPRERPSASRRGRRACPPSRSTLGVDNIQIGLMLLGAGIASIIGLSLATVVLARFGARTRDARRDPRLRRRRRAHRRRHRRRALLSWSSSAASCCSASATARST